MKSRLPQELKQITEIDSIEVKHTTSDSLTDNVIDSMPSIIFNHTTGTIAFRLNTGNTSDEKACTIKNILQVVAAILSSSAEASDELVEVMCSISTALSFLNGVEMVETQVDVEATPLSIE